MKRVVPGLLLVALLAGCQAPVRMSNMIVPGTDRIAGQTDRALAVQVGSVSGGSSLNVLNQIRVSDLDLREALINSLAVRGALAASQPRYRVDAELLRTTRGLQEILLGLNVTAEVEIRYLVTDTATGAVVLSRPIVSTGTASSSDYFSPTERTRVATERAIQDNMRKLLAELYGL
ncbi:hypothetical protein JL100_006530 [Skermanella mucosa]|uniref:hypothetical protein n=1 Tax=Skermanella mucosa TaxID=1789672 RepID=UPI00192B1CE1|nr:hypothetical protein [Skermanella mucosa]UEM22397.1 hypothetical protein JL100_006530 [Skermanella mucosa]